MKYYVVDAFTDEQFKGNPAGVCVLDEFLDKALMQKIAFENNLAETAFIVPRDGYYDLKWFTPELEMDLCGHATIASAYIVKNYIDKNAAKIDFHTLSGILSVIKKGDIYEMNFPSRMPEKSETTQLIASSIGVTPIETQISKDPVGYRYFVLLENEDQVKTLVPDFEQIKTIPNCFGLIVTAKSSSVDFVSRFFAPNAGVNEDPVTGSIHSTLIPYWAEKLGKDTMIAKQLSKRGGTLYCENLGDRVTIGGKAVLYLEGSINL